MRNIIRIFIGDILKMKYNVVAWIMIMGMTVVPCLYAWFNIAASWDPYGSTGNLKVAVVNTDGGYSGDLIPIEVNIGETITNELRKNDRMDWTFTTKAKALRGVRSGEYYAAIIIPKSFSDDMMSFFTTDVTHSKILYYVNQKENAIAPKVTDSGASTVQREISRNFLSTLAEVELDLMNGLSDTLTSSDAKTVLTNLHGNLAKADRQLRTTAGTVDAVSDLTGSLADMLDQTSGFLRDSGEAVQDTRKTLSGTKKDVDALSRNVNTAVDGMDDMLDQLDQVYDSVDQQIGNSLNQMDQDLSAGEASLQDLNQSIGAIVRRYQTVRSRLEQVDSALPARPYGPHRIISRMEGRLDTSIAEQQALQQDISDIISSSSSSRASVKRYRQQLRSDVAQIRKTVSGLQTDYEKNGKKELRSLLRSMNTSMNSLDGLLGSFSQLTGQTSALSTETAGNLSDLHDLLDGTAGRLSKAEKKLRQMTRQISRAADSGDLEALRNLMENSPSDIANFLSAPVNLQRVAVYPVKNYGSAMAPFYSTLALWVGAVILVALMKTDLTAERRRELPGLKPHQEYFGRLILYSLIGILQATLTALGDVLYLGIQCEHPVLFLFTCWISSLVYVVIMYTMVLAFGDVGKAICVVLMVMQVAGSGGTFPIQMLQRFFWPFYRFLPFVHSMNAMRECIGGFYQNDFWLDIGKLLLFIPPMLIVGLILRRPIIRLNRWFNRKLESTKLM